MQAGVLEKMGGGEGGHKNWKKRYFVYRESGLEHVTIYPLQVYTPPPSPHVQL